MSGSRGRAALARRAKAFSLNGFGALIALVTLFPIFWMVSTAVKPSQQIYSLTPSLLPASPTLGNYREVISGQVSGIGSVFLFFRNSLAVTLATVLLASLLSLLASVAVARFRFRFRTSSDRPDHRLRRSGAPGVGLDAAQFRGDGAARA